MAGTLPMEIPRPTNRRNLLSRQFIFNHGTSKGIGFKFPGVVGLFLTKVYQVTPCEKPVVIVFVEVIYFVLK